MQLKKLDSSFYGHHTHLVEDWDNHQGQWQTGKVRGYGVVIISIKNLTFTIPLRSNISHKAAYIIVKSQEQGVRGKELDYSKALLITNMQYIANVPFKISASEHNTLQNKEVFITSQFDKYVARYIKAVKKQDNHILNSIEYRFTILKNYHVELELV
jgi:protein AbiQ